MATFQGCYSEQSECFARGYYQYQARLAKDLAAYCGRSFGSEVANKNHPPPPFSTNHKIVCIEQIVARPYVLCIVEPLNKGHFGAASLPFIQRLSFAQRLNNTTAICLMPSHVSIIGRLSLARRVLYRRFHCNLALAPLILVNYSVQFYFL